MDKIFKYPAVQYIPLQIYKAEKGNSQFHSEKTRIILNESQKEGFLEIKILNALVEFIKYRGYEVFLVGKTRPGKYHKFKIIKKYFYKDRLIFSFYDKSTGERLDYKRYQLNN